MNNSINRFTWLTLGIAFGVVLTGGVVLCFRDPMMRSEQNRQSNATIEHTVARPESPSPATDSTLSSPPEMTNVQSGSSVPGIASSKPSPDTSPAEELKTPPVPVEKAPNPDFERLAAEARQLLDIVRKLDFTSQPLPEYASLLKQLADTAKTAEELKVALGLKDAFAAASQQVEQKRQTWFLAELGERQGEFERLLALPVTSADSVIRQVKSLLDDCNSLRKSAPAGLEKECDSLTGKMNEFVQTLTENEKIYTALESLDKVTTNQELEEGLRQIASRYPKSPYAQDLPAVEKTFSSLAAIEDWNKFVRENGRMFDVFAVRPQTIAAANAFFHGQARNLHFLPEWKVLQQRLKLLQNAAKDLPVSEKIVPLLRHAGSRPFWIYKKTPNQWYYLTHKPQAGNNHYLADLFGTEKTVFIPHEALPLISEAEFIAFFNELAQKVSELEDTIRFDDTGKWYASWCDIINAMRTRNDLDPIVQFLFLKDICSALAAADSSFANRLAPWLRVLNSSDFATGVDWYDAQGKKTDHLRMSAAQLLRFLQGDKVSVSKTTEELNQTIKPISFVFSSVGWLDRTPAGNWFCRPFALLTPQSDGDLFLLIPSREQLPQRWIAIGHIEQGKTKVELVSNELLRGMPVFLRSPHR